ncbi:MAG: prolyl-tRNA synthetase associated domain-containing protein [Alphaproteobacteria bacterium]|nr:prolyl-tRNA synthetase associated domain-containing protein [Alphaproteobacteria bacterium]
MPCTVEQLYSFLDRLGIEHETVNHPPIFTEEQGRTWRDKIPAKPCKNLFLKDVKGQLWLIVLPTDKRADLKSIARRIGAPRFSFAKPEVLAEVLATTPGSVSPFALLNDKTRRVHLVLDEEMFKCDKISCHPLENTASTILTPTDFMKFIEALSYEPIIVDCGKEAANV